MWAHFAAHSTACRGGGLERFTEHTLLSGKMKDRRGADVPDPMGVVAAHAAHLMCRSYHGSPGDAYYVYVLCGVCVAVASLLYVYVCNIP